MGYTSNWAVALGVSSERKDLEGMRKEDPAKVLVAAFVEKKNGGDKRLDCGTVEHGASWVSESPCGNRKHGGHA
jgi:hypothetical protein